MMLATIPEPDNHISVFQPETEYILSERRLSRTGL